VKQASPGQSQATQSRGAALGNEQRTKSGRGRDFPNNRPVAETATSRVLFRPRQAGEPLVARLLGRILVNCSGERFSLSLRILAWANLLNAGVTSPGPKLALGLQSRIKPTYERRLRSRSPLTFNSASPFSTYALARHRAVKLTNHGIAANRGGLFWTPFEREHAGEN
jgi:hypothetical protein